MIKTNKKMNKIMRRARSQHVRLPKSLLGTIKSGFIVTNGCFFVTALYDKPRNVTLAAFPDQTGFECCVNHFHIDDYVKDDAKQLCLALALIDKIKKKWSQWDYCKLPIEFIVSINKSSSVLKFHVIRPGQQFMDEDLENYEDDAVLICNFNLGKKVLLGT